MVVGWESHGLSTMLGERERGAMSSEYLGSIEKAIDLWFAGECLDALFALEQALELPDADHVAFELLLALYSCCGEPDSAVRLCGTMARNGVPRERFVTPEAALFFGWNLMWMGMPAWVSLHELAKRSAAAFPASPRPACLLAHYCFERRQYSRALRAAERQKELGGDCAQCRDILALASAKLGIAGPPLERADPDLANQTADELWRTAFQAEAEAARDVAPIIWSHVLAKVRLRSDALYGLGRSYIRNKQWIEAIGVFDELLGAMPRHGWALNSRAYAITKAMGRRHAMDTWKDVIDRVPWLFNVWRFQHAYGVSVFRPLVLKLGRTKAKEHQRMVAECYKVVKWMFPREGKPRSRST